MKRTIKIIFVSLFIISGITTLAGKPFTVTVNIEFNGEQKNISENVVNEKELSALEALMYVATIQTHPAGGYVFVDIINGIENIRGKNAWYFNVNGTPSDKLAIDKELKNGDVITWIYKQDVCSKTIEKQPIN